MMQLIPAIDLRQGSCVRLLKGDFDRQTTYQLDPRELARRYEDWGASWLHMVDLDGAQSGVRENRRIIGEVAQRTGLKVQVGGGIRSEEDLREVLAMAQRAVVGSVAIENPETFRRWLGNFGPDRLVLALDVTLDENATPWVAVRGWQERSNTTLSDAIGLFQAHGLTHVLCTDIARDGALAGPNISLYQACLALAPSIRWQASGGVASAQDLRALETTGVDGAISGKALLDNLIRPEELQAFLPNA